MMQVEIKDNPSNPSMSQEISLGAAFRLAKRKYANNNDNSIVREGIQEFSEIADRIDSARVFSSNESLEDISSKDLPLMSVGFYLGNLYEHLKTTDKDDRVKVVDKMEYWFKRFIQTCKEYGIIPDIYKHMDDDEGEQNIKKDAATKRQEKIAIFKYEKQLGSEIGGLEAKVSQDQDDEQDYQRIDEDTIRNLYIKEIQLHVMQAFHSLDSIKLERDMLRHREAVSGGGGVVREESNDKQAYSERLEQPLLSKSVKTNFLGQGLPINRVNRPFTLVGNSNDKRQQLRNQVFQSDYRLPTMGVDEYLDNLQAQGGIISQQDNQPAPKEDEDSEQAQDRETYKQREWDAFAEENPRGSGNRMMNRG